MEPLAPGTEDENVDSRVDYNSLNKQEAEHDRLLKIRSHLRNGVYGNVFELSYLNGNEHWYCQVCECPIMGRVYQHELGRRHTQNIETYNNKYSDSKEKEVENQTKSYQESEELTSLEIAPGEPVPPGFESELREAQIQERLDGFKVGPLVALEYLIEMQDYDPTKEPTYLCILCDKKGDPRTVLTHLASYNHISQYLQKHFPMCYRALAPYMTKQYKRNWQNVLQKVAEAIEKKFGRLRPFCINQDKFEKERMQYLSMIMKGKHFSEQMGPTFVELVNHEELTKTFDDDGRPVKPATTSFEGKPFIEREPVKRHPQKRSPSPPVVARPTKRPRAPIDETKKPSDAASAKPGPNRMRRRSLSSVSSESDGGNKGGRRMARNRSPPRDRFGRRPNSRERDIRGGGRRRSPSPRRRKDDDEEERRRNREKERQQKFEEYTKLSKAIENDIEKTLKQHEKNPEKHPKYNEEWKIFWNRRYKELQLEGKDPTKHDFKPEWIEFWGKRMRDLSDEELKNRKVGLRRRLGLSEEEPAAINFKIGGGPSNAPPSKSSQPRENRPNMPMAARPDNDPEVIFLDDKDNAPPPKRANNRDRRDGSHSPWESDESPPRTMVRGKRPSPGGDNRRRGVRGNVRERSRERSFEKRGPERRRSPSPRLRPVPSPRNRRSPIPDRSRRSPDRSRRSPDRIRRSPDRGRRSPDRTKRSLERDRWSPSRGRRSPVRDRERRSRSIELSLRRSKETMLRISPAHSRGRRSRSPEIYKGNQRFSRERDFFRGGRERDLEIVPGPAAREHSWERGIRESSFERDVRGRERIRTVAELPWEREKMYSHGPPPRMMPHDDFYGPPMMRDIRPNPKLNFVPPGVDEEPDDGEVNLVSVLRLLTALEEKLGSLGPKIIDLLAQALAMEKKEANSSETLLDNEIICVMFETVKEKLKGQLLAGLVDIHQERAFKKAIQKTANLIHIAGTRKRSRSTPAVAVPGVGAVDKAAIAKQLANALVAQGKTNVTQAELEQLINAVVGMAEASKNSSKPMTAANFIAQLTGGGGQSDQQKDKVIIPRVRSGDDKRDKGKDLFADLDTEPLSPSTPERPTSNMENLSDSDLQTLLQNFKDLSTEEQMNLINYLKKMELDEPERVERLRKFVNLGGDKSSKDVIDLDKESSPDRNGKNSPFSRGHNDSDYQGKKKGDKGAKLNLDSEDEDYSFDDVVKAASKNIKQKEIEDSRKIVQNSIDYSTAQSNLTDAKALISNLMSSISASNAAAAVNLLGLPASTASASLSSLTNTTSSADFAKALNSINMDSLASIVSNVQKATQEKKINFEPPPTASPEKSAPEPSKPLSFEPPEKAEPSINPLPTPSAAPLLPSTGGNVINLGAAPGGPAVGPKVPMQPITTGPVRMSLLRPMESGPVRIGPGPGNPGIMPLNLGPRGVPGPMPLMQRFPPNQFGNPNLMNQRAPFNHSFNPRFGGPRGQGFNNRW